MHHHGLVLNTNPADLFTKAVCVHAFCHCMMQLPFFFFSFFCFCVRPCCRAFTCYPSQSCHLFTCVYIYRVFTKKLLSRSCFTLTLLHLQTAAVFIDLSSIQPFKGYGWLCFFFSSTDPMCRANTRIRWSC